MSTYRLHLLIDHESVSAAVVVASDIAADYVFLHIILRTFEDLM